MTSLLDLFFVSLPTPDNWTKWEVNREAKDHQFFFESFDDEFWYDFQLNYWWLAYLFVAMYWVGSYFLDRFMKNRDPFPVEGLIVGYNIFVTLFSTFALWRLGETVLRELSRPNGIHLTLCTRFEVTEKEMFWSVVFIWSKLIHFLDTILATLRKRELNYMQMFHHSLSVLIPHHISPYGEPILMLIAVTNLIQHSITYFYFALKSMKLAVPKFIPLIIIGVEILQMIVGLGSGIYTINVLKRGESCVRHPKSITVFNNFYIILTIWALKLAYDHLSKSTGKIKNT